MPLLTANNSWKSHIPVIGQSTIIRKRPRHMTIQIAHDLPMRKDLLHLFGVAELQRPQQQALSLQQIHLKTVQELQVAESAVFPFRIDLFHRGQALSVSQVGIQRDLAIQAVLRATIVKINQEFTT